MRDNGGCEVGELNVSVDELIDASVSVENIANDIDGGVRAFAAEVDCLLSEWSGLSANQFEGSWVEWQDGASRVVEALRMSSGLLADGARSYASQDTATRETLGGIQGQL